MKSAQCTGITQNQQSANSSLGSDCYYHCLKQNYCPYKSEDAGFGANLLRFVIVRAFLTWLIQFESNLLNCYNFESYNLRPLILYTFKSV